MKMIKHWTSAPHELFYWFLAGIWLCMIYPRPSTQNFIPFKNQWKTSDDPDVEFFKIFRSVVTFFRRAGVEQTTILVGQTTKFCRNSHLAWQLRRLLSSELWLKLIL